METRTQAGLQEGDRRIPTVGEVCMAALREPDDALRGAFIGRIGSMKNRRKKMAR